jgi:hypothetical protein
VGCDVIRVEVGLGDGISRRRWPSAGGPPGECPGCAFSEFERYTQAWIGNVREPETTGKFAAATFEHDIARLFDGYAAPQLHTHAVIFNVTERENGQTRSLQTHQMNSS